MDFIDPAAAIESFLANAGDAVRDRDARQTAAVIESIAANAGDAVFYDCCSNR